jgi:hypothetical protein
MGEIKKRRGCLTAYLTAGLIVNPAIVLLYPAGGTPMKQTYPGAPAWGLPVLIVCGLVNILSLTALLRRKKWGFWLFTGMSLFTLLVNLAVGAGLFPSLFGLAGPALLYGVLQIGEEDKAWLQLG